jgi:hypothetical protein
MTVSYRPIEGFPGYRVGDDGSVWSCKRPGSRAARTGDWFRRCPTLSEGYPTIMLYRDSQFKCFRVHLLVARAFLGKCPEGMECCHNDGNRQNARLDNLRYDTPRNNNADKIRHGTVNNGSRNGMAKLTEDAVAVIKLRISRGDRSPLIARDFDVSRGAINGIKRGARWRHIAAAEEIAEHAERKW